MEIFGKKINFSWRSFGENFGKFWNKYFKVVFFGALFIALILALYVWYLMLFSPVWDEKKKNDFVSAQDKGVVLKEREFGKVTEFIDAREKRFNEQYKSVRDVFKSF